MTVSVPYSWLKQIPPSLLQKEGAAPLGHTPLFPWEEFASTLAQALQAQKIALQPGAWQQLDVDRHTQGFGADPALFTIDLAPLPGLMWLVVAKTELDRFISWMLTRQESTETLLDAAYQEGFCQFIALEFFSAFRKSAYGKELTPHLVALQPLTQELLYAQDANFELDGAPPFAVRLIFSEELRHAWKEKFAERSVSGAISIALAEKLSVTLHLECGHTVLSAVEWKAVLPGDFLLLNHCSMDPAREKVKVLLTLNGRPLYRARLKEGKLKILEFPLYHEVESTMATHETDEEFEGFEGFDEDALDNAAVEDTAKEEVSLSAAHAAEAIDEDSPNLLQDSAAPEEAALQEELPYVSEEGKVNVANLPLTLVVEIGRLQVSVRKLLEMQTGDLLDLNLDADSSVDLVVNGSVVAKGELLKIGEVLGVRILDKV